MSSANTFNINKSKSSNDSQMTEKNDKKEMLLFHRFPLDKNTYAIDTQFMWGSSLLIAPVLLEVRIKKFRSKLAFFLFNPLLYR